MKINNKNLLIGFLFILLIVLSVGSVTAKDTNTTLSSKVEPQDMSTTLTKDSALQTNDNSLSSIKEKPQSKIKNNLTEVNNKVVKVKNNTLENTHNNKEIKSIKKEDIQDNSFKNLQKQIDETENTLTLTHNYTKTDTDNTIIINKTFILNGNGYTINAKNNKGIFTITNNAKVTLKNIILVNSTDSAITTDINTDLILENTTATNNKAKNGGVIYNKGNLYISYSTFDNNSVVNYGGVICNNGTDNTYINIENSLFMNNTATTPKNGEGEGGAIYTKLSSLTVTNTKFINNTAAVTETNGGNGGAICIEDTANPITITNSNFTKSVSRYGAAILVNNYHSSCDKLAEVTITNCNFTDNEGLHGATYFLNTTVNIEGTTFNNNSATYLRSDKQNSMGGAICFDYNAICNINNSVFTNNSAVGRGGAISGGIFEGNRLIVNNTLFEGNYLLNKTKSFGGAIDTLVNATILNSKFINNTAVNGGAIINIANMTIENTTFTNNTAVNKGGAIANNCTENNKVEIHDSTFIENRVTTQKHNTGQGGAIYTKNTEFILNNSTFTNNSVYSTENIGGDGGAICIENTLNNVLISNSTFTNSSSRYGAAFSISNYGLINDNLKNTTIINCNIRNNSGLCGATYFITANVTLINTTYTNNNATTLRSDKTDSTGGAINYDYGVNCTILNSTFTNNSAYGRGGAIYGGITNTNILNIENTLFENNTVLNTTNSHGGAIYASENVTINNSTFTNNKAHYGGAIYTEDTLTLSNSTITNSTNAVEFKNSNITNNTYSNTNITTTITTSEIPEIMIIDDKLDIIINIKAEDKYNTTINTGVIEVYQNNVLIDTIAVVNGSATYKYTAVNKKEELTFRYVDETSAFTQNSITKTINARQLDVHITVDPIETKYVGETITIKATIKDENDDLLDGSVIIKIGNDTVNTNVVNGIVNYNYTLKQAGTYNITVSYLGTSRYTSAEESIPITVTKLNTKITTNIPNTVKALQNITINATLKDSNDNILINKDIILKINGKTITTLQTDANGNITYNYTTKNMGLYNINLIYVGSDVYIATNTSNIVSVESLKTSIILNNITTKYNDTTTIVVGVIDEFGNDVNGGKVIVKINGKTLKDTDGNIIFAYVTNGTAKITTTLSMKPKTYNITAVYGGKSYYESARTNNSTLIITKRDAVVSFEDIPQPEAGSDVEIKVKVVDADADTLVNTGCVILKLNGKTLKDTDGQIIYTNVINGTAVVKYNIPSNFKAKEYKLTAVFANNVYNRAEANSTLTIIKASNNTNTTQNSDNTIKTVKQYNINPKKEYIVKT